MISENVIKAIEERIPKTLEAIGTKMEEVIKDSISTVSPPASLPGEPPHKVTGAIYEGIHYAVHSDHVEISSTQNSGEVRPIDLEYGTSRTAPRPYMATAMARLDHFMPDIVDENM